MSVNWQFGYSYDLNNGVTPYSALQTTRHTHTPTITLPSNQDVVLQPSIGFQPALKAGLKGSVLWDVASGMHCNASTLSILALRITFS